MAGSVATSRLILDRTIQEIEDGIRAANQKYLGKLVIAKIQIVPEDYPAKAQAQAAAFKIAEAALTTEG